MIRQTAEAAATKFHTDYPLSVKRFETEGKSIFTTLLRQHHDDPLWEDLRYCQHVFQEVVRPYFKYLEFGEQEALRFWPLGKKGRVVLDPLRRFGQPLDAPTGVPTRSLYEAARAEGGQEIRTVAQWFDVPPKAVEQAILFEESLA